jgi:hypothetical protein
MSDLPVDDFSPAVKSALCAHVVSLSPEALDAIAARLHPAAARGEKDGAT